MATAAKNARPRRDVTRAADAGAQTTTIEFLIYEVNSGGYRWTIVGSGAESLAQSRTFPRYEDARRAATEVRDGASSALLEAPAPATLPSERVASHEPVPARNDATPERRLDEGANSAARR